MRLARSTSSSALSRATLPICLRYARTESADAVSSASLRAWRSASDSSSSSHSKSPPSAATSSASGSTATPSGPATTVSSSLRPSDPASTTATAVPSPATAVRTVPSPAPGEGAIVGLVRVPLAAGFAGTFFRAAGAVPADPTSAVTVLTGFVAAALVRGARVPVAAFAERVLTAAASGAGWSAGTQVPSRTGFVPRGPCGPRAAAPVLAARQLRGPGRPHGVWPLDGQGIPPGWRATGWGSLIVTTCRRYSTVPDVRASLRRGQPTCSGPVITRGGASAALRLGCRSRSQASLAPHPWWCASGRLGPLRGGQG